MNSESENFEQLRRLLALKRHEQPPPRYFVDFSSQVLARIRAEEAGTHRSTEGTWWQRLWTAFEMKQAFAGVFGVAVCAVLVSGMFGAGGNTPSVSQARDLPADLQVAAFERTPPVEMVDSNTIALKQLFASLLPLQGAPASAVPASFTVPRR